MTIGNNYAPPAVEYTTNGSRLVEIDVDGCDPDFGDIVLMIHDGGLRYHAYLSQEQAMQLGSALCAKALTARDQVMVMPPTDRDGEWRRDLSLVAANADRLDAAEGDGRR